MNDQEQDISFEIFISSFKLMCMSVNKLEVIHF